MKRNLAIGTLLALIVLHTSPAAAQNPHTRSGFWFNVGVGYGSLGCEDCGDREGGSSGQIGLGGTLSRKVMLGAMANGWSKSEDDVSLTVSTLVAAIRFYPSATGGFFLTGGLGMGSIRVAVDGLGSETETGSGAMLGLGWDLRVGRNVSVTPFLNSFAMSSNEANANVLQFGFSATIH